MISFLSLKYYIKKYSYMKWRYRSSKAAKALVRKRGNRLLLFGTPEYGNLGDHLIARAALQFFSDVFPDQPIIEITQANLIWDREFVYRHVLPGDLLIYTGGGFMGTLYMRYGEEFIREVLKRHPNHNVIILPQTIFYENTASACYDLEIAKEFYGKHSNCTICVRDKASYEFALENNLAKPERLFMLPDMALYLFYGKAGVTPRKGRTLVCLRNDRESIQENDAMSIQHYVQEISEHIVRVTTRPAGNIRLDARDARLNRLVRQFQEAQIVVTDRLHAMLLSAITATPCIAFDNLTGKVKGAHAWLGHLGYIKFAEKAEDIISFDIDTMIHEAQKTRNLDLNDYYKQLREICRRARFPQE